MPASRTIAGYYASLCSVAMEFGFYNCEPLRALPENQEYLNRPVEPGDIVYIPERVDSEFSKPVDNRHNFTVKAALPPSIRIVKGVGFNPDQDFERNSIPVSNYVTTKQGTNTANSFPTSYDYVPSVDPDAFRVEVYDPAASGTVNVKLEALKPRYKFDWGRMIPYSWETSSETGRSIPALACQANPSPFAHHFISKYLRLVVDEADLNAPGLSNQLLSVSDYITGLDDRGRPDDPATVEILHQQIRATYELPRCPGNPKCAISAVLPVADESTVLRFKLRFFVFQDLAARQDSTSLGVPITDARNYVRRRVKKWCRRAFAQVGITPSVDFFDGVIPVQPPGENMMCLSHGHGRSVAPAGARLDFSLTGYNEDEPEPVQVVFQGGENLAEVANLIEQALPNGYSATIFGCPSPPDEDPAVDLIITKIYSPSPPRIFDVQLSQGAGFTVDIPRVNLQSVIVDDDSRDNTRSRLSPDLKRLLRARQEWGMALEPDVINVIVVEGFNTPSLQGIAFPEFYNAPYFERPGEHFQSAIVIPANCAAGPTLDGGDNLPYLLPSLIAQVLGDMRLDPSDTLAATSLLNPVSSTANSVTATKRLPDEPYGTYVFPSGSSRSQRFNMSERIRNAGSSKLSSL